MNLVFSVRLSFAEKVLNPTNGSWWMVQILSTERNNTRD